MIFKVPSNTNHSLRLWGCKPSLSLTSLFHWCYWIMFWGSFLFGYHLSFGNMAEFSLLISLWPKNTLFLDQFLSKPVWTFQSQNSSSKYVFWSAVNYISLAFHSKIKKLYEHFVNFTIWLNLAHEPASIFKYFNVSIFVFSNVQIVKNFTEITQKLEAKPAFSLCIPEPK